MKRIDFKKLLANKRRKKQLAKMAILGLVATGVSGIGLTSVQILDALAEEVEVGAKSTVTGVITYTDKNGAVQTINVLNGATVDISSSAGSLTIKANGKVYKIEDPTSLDLNNVFISDGAEIRMNRLRSFTANNVTAMGSFEIDSCSDLTKVELRNSTFNGKLTIEDSDNLNLAQAYNCTFNNDIKYYDNASRKQGGSEMIYHNCKFTIPKDDGEIYLNHGSSSERTTAYFAPTGDAIGVVAPYSETATGMMTVTVNGKEVDYSIPAGAEVKLYANKNGKIDVEVNGKGTYSFSSGTVTDLSFIM